MGGGGEGEEWEHLNMSHTKIQVCIEADLPVASPSSNIRPRLFKKWIALSTG